MTFFSCNWNHSWWQICWSLFYVICLRSLGARRTYPFWCSYYSQRMQLFASYFGFQLSHFFLRLQCALEQTNCSNVQTMHIFYLGEVPTNHSAFPSNIPEIAFHSCSSRENRASYRTNKLTRKSWTRIAEIGRTNRNNFMRFIGQFSHLISTRISA